MGRVDEYVPIRGGVGGVSSSKEIGRNVPTVVLRYVWSVGKPQLNYTITGILECGRLFVDQLVKRDIWVFSVTSTSGTTRL